MRIPQRLFHITLSMLSAVLIVGVPLALKLDFFGEKVDAVSQATMELPEQPSGEYIVLINASLHEDTIDDWKSFLGDEYAVIFDDIHCTVANGDEAGMQLAERYKAQLPENQMTVRSEDAALLASKAESGLIDAAIFSKEMAQAIKLSPDKAENVSSIEITGGAADEKA